MIQIKDLKVCSLDLNFHEVSWAVEDNAESAFDYAFQVLRSESAMGPFEPISISFEDRYVFVDNILQIAHRWRIYFYIVRVTHKASGNTKDFGPASKEPPADLYALEIRRHVQLLFHEHAGRRCWILPVRTFGQRCPDSWDPYKQKLTRSGCQTCFDTGFVRGYLHPIEIWGQIDPSPKSEQNTNVGSQQQVDTTARFGSFPPMKPRDVIIEAENLRWRIVKVTQTEKARARIHQELQIHRIPEKDIEFVIPLVLGTPLKDLAISPERNFINASSLADFQQKNMPDIFNLYTDPWMKL